MTTPDLERRIRTWFADEIGEAEAPSSVYAFLGAIPQSVPREQGLFGRRTFALLAAVVLLVGLVAGAIAVGSGLLKLPSILPPPSPNPVTSPAPSALPTPPVAIGRVVYQRHTRIADGQPGACATPSATGCTQWSTVFVANDDGSEPRELTPGAWDAEPVALAPDGTRLIVRLMGFELREDHHYLSDLSGSGLELLDTGCRAPCIGDSGFAFSPDGERLAFIRSFGTAEPTIQITESVLAIMDWVTGEVVELDSTRIQGPTIDQLCSQGCPLGRYEPPRWSPDGERLVFTVSDIRVPADLGYLGTLTFIVDDDGRNLRELVPLELFARDAQWSPDGAHIVFTSAVQGVTEGQAFYQLNDIYAVRPDGTELTRLTTYSEGPIEAFNTIGALRPSWTLDGRIVFVLILRGEPSNAPEVWIMDANGSNPRALVPADASTFTRIGCMTCPYPLEDLADAGENLSSGGHAIWLARP